MGRKKKILAVVGATYVFGAEKVALDVISGLKENGYDVHCLVSGWNDGDFISRLEKIGVTYTSIKLGWYYLRKIMWSLDSLVHYPRAILDFIRLKKRFNPDIIYTISYRQIALLFPFFGNNIIYHIHDTNSQSRQSKFLLRLIDKKILKYIAVSNFIKKDIAACGINSQKVEVIHNGINISILNHKQFMPNGILRLGIVGQVIPRKGHLIVLEALKFVLDKGINAQLAIVGAGDSEFEQKVKQRAIVLGINTMINWKGFVKDVSEIYTDIDIVIAPTLNEEPFGLIACEANMFGLPIIVSDKGGLPEIIQDGVNGFTFNAVDAGELAEKIVFLYKHPEIMKEMGEKGREIAITRFSKAHMNEKINRLLCEI